MARLAVSSMGYSSRVTLVACPFCREMFEEGEARQCPVCGMALAKLEKLPPSVEATEDGLPVDPTEEVLPMTYLGRGRGALVAAAMVGLALFFMPWIHTTLPAVQSYSGFDLAKGGGWVWGAGVSWFVLLPTVLSRRTIFHMRGARVAAAFLSAIPALTAAIFLLRPPHATGKVPLEYSFQWGIFAMVLVGMFGVFTAFKFGGRADDIKMKKGTSAGQTLH